LPIDVFVWLGSESSGKQTAHNLRPWIDLKDDRYNTEHKFPHVYTGFGVPSKLKVTATGPLRNAPPYVTTSQVSHIISRARH
jgi:hypothetical protein